MSVNYTDWYDQVLPSVPGCGQGLALNAIREAVINFCERSRAWQEYPAAISADGSATYAIPVSSGYAETSPVRIERAYYETKEIEIISEEQAASKYGLNDWRDQQGDPLCILQIDPENFYLLPSPQDASTDAIELLVSYKPTRASTAAKDFLWQRYMMGITYGALAILLKMPKKPWTDTQLGIYYDGMFTNAIDKAHTEVFKGFGRAKPRAKVTWF